MADNYSTGTLTPCIPASAVNEFEFYLLEVFGFQIYTDEGQLYLCEEGLFDYGSSVEGEGMLYTFHEFEGKGFELAGAILKTYNKVPDDPTTYVDDDDRIVSAILDNIEWETLLQTILKKPECNHIQDFILEGAWWCSKNRQGEFGGYVVRITRDNIQSASTNSIVNDWRYAEGVSHG